MAVIHTIKRGDTFRVQVAVEADGVPLDMTNYPLPRAQVRRGNKLIADLELEWVNRAGGTLMMSAPLGTEAWPLGDLQSDIEYTTDSGDIVSTETYEIEVIEDITR